MTNSFRYSSSLETAEALKRGGSIRLIDVREPGEFETERVADSINIPLSSFAAGLTKLRSTDEIHVLCQVGARAASAAAQLTQKGFSNVAVVTGGINLWKHEDLPTIKGQRHVWSMERQVRLGAGSLVLLGVGLSLIDPRWIALSAFVGGGLVFSALTGFCGMAKLLALAPWNR